MSWIGAITSVGSGLLAKWAEQGAVLNIVQIVAGTGTVSELDLRQQTALVNQKQVGTASAKSQMDAGFRITTEFAGVAGDGYKMQQIGIIAELTVGGQTERGLLSIYQNAVGQDIPSISDVPDFLYAFFAGVAVTNQGELEITVDPTSFLSRGEFDTYKEQEEQNLDGKVDKNTAGTLGNIIQFGAQGSLVDSGKKVGEFALATALTQHVGTVVNSEAGVHGLRWFGNELAFKDGKVWRKIETGGGLLPYVVVSAPAGSTITVTNGTTTLTDVIAGGIATIELPGYGSWQVTATLGSQTSGTITLDVDVVKEYQVTLSYFLATINVTGVAGATVTCSKSGTATQTKTIGSGGTAQFQVYEAGTYSLNASLNGKSKYGQAIITTGGQSVTVDLSFVKIYGAMWDGTSSTVWSRTDEAATFTNPIPALSNGNGSSPFDSCMPWSGMKRVTDGAAGELVEIPKFYFKWTRSGATMKLQIADGPVEGFHVSPAHANRGDGKGERDVVYVGRYHCSTSNWKSQTGVKPKANITRSSARSGIHGLGSDIWQMDYAMRWTIQMLYLVEFANWNSQACIGYGCGNNSATENMGYTDGMAYHTGTTKSSRTTYGLGTQYRYIEGLWDNVYDWIDGIYFSGTAIYGIQNPANFSDSSGGTNIGTRANNSNYISGYTAPTQAGFEYALYPNAISGSESTYVCDYCGYDSSDVVLYAGGDYSQDQSRGLFCLFDYSVSHSVVYIGCRLQKLP